MNKVATIDELRSAQGNAQAFQAPAVFDPAAWHAMQARDDTLIRDLVLHGVTDDKWIYEFDISGKKVSGVSVIGARHLASQYGGIRSRIVASVDKTGSLFVFKSFEPLGLAVQRIFELEDLDDFYEVVMEITDIKTGNSIQVRKKETKTEKRSGAKGGGTYERPHFDVIAESKAFRNGVLSLLPQDVVKQFMVKAKNANKAGNEKTMDQLRAGVLSFAAKNAVSIQREAVEDLTYEQIYGLGNAANAGLPQFRASAIALGLIQVQDEGMERSRPTAARQQRPAGAITDDRAAQAEAAVTQQVPRPEPVAVGPQAPDDGNDQMSMD